MESDRDRRIALEGFVRYHDDRIWKQTQKLVREEKEAISSMQIHYFLPSTKDYLEAKRKIRRAILEEGGTYPDVTVLMEPDNKTRHIVFECEFENDYDMEE